MTNHFATLGEAPRPWLDVEELKEKFHALSAGAHPDRVHGAAEAIRREAAGRYAAVNEAYQCLREPRSRLHHLIFLTRGTKPGDSNQIPDDLLRLFSETGSLIRQADALLSEKDRTGSPMLKARLLERALPCLVAIDQLQSSLRARHNELNTQLRELDARWAASSLGPGDEDAALQTAERLYHLYGFIERWLAQLQERAFRLTL